MQQFEVDWVLGEPTEPAVAGTLDHFLIERYSLFVRRGGAIYRGRVRHQPYPLRDVTIEHLPETMLGAAGCRALARSVRSLKSGDCFNSPCALPS